MVRPDYMPSDAITIRHPDASSPYVIVCEHASCFIPPEYDGLGLSPELVKGHIGWDIHAEDVATQVALMLGAPLVTASVSRLVTDLNRPETCQDCIPGRSETISVPGNLGLSPQEREGRLAKWHRPFHEGLSALLDARSRHGLSSILVGIHSFTPIYDGVTRPWSAGVLYRASQTYGEAVAQAMSSLSGEMVGCNQPYDLWVHSNHTIPFHGDARGLPAIIVEIRNDLLATPAAVAHWANITAQSLQTGRRCSLPCINNSQIRTA